MKHNFIKIKGIKRGNFHIVRIDKIINIVALYENNSHKELLDDTNSKVYVQHTGQDAQLFSSEKPVDIYNRLLDIENETL
jgi:hypothetical protein